MSRETVCFSMYSLMSSEISALLAAEQELGERLGQLGLAHAGRAEEDERPTGTARVLEPGASPAYRLADRSDRFVLADDALVKHVLHAEQLGGLLLGEVGDRNTRPHRDDLGDLALGHLDDASGVRLEPLLFHRALLGEDLLLLVAQRGRLLELLRLDRRFLLGAHLAQPVVDLSTPGGAVIIGCASSRRPRRSGRSPCRAGSGPRCSGRPAWQPRRWPRP